MRRRPIRFGLRGSASAARKMLTAKIMFVSPRDRLHQHRALEKSRDYADPTPPSLYYGNFGLPGWTRESQEVGVPPDVTASSLLAPVWWRVSKADGGSSRAVDKENPMLWKIWLSLTDRILVNVESLGTIWVFYRSLPDEK
jgi:hypothetical protein